MNSDNPEQVMENNAISSKNKKKSKGKLKTEATALNDVIGRTQKKSFWKSLFRFKKHHADPGNASTHVITVELGANNEETKAVPKLSSIFEETPDPATLDPKTIAEDISEIKKTIKRMSETSNPSIIIDKITNPPTPTPKGKKRTKDDAFLGYLSDISSTSSEEDETEKPQDYCGITQDNTSTYTDLLGDDKPKGGSSSLLKEGYSFEYSETSENSDDVLDDKPEKVTFDNKVETKDANSNITVRPLDENDSRVMIEEIVGIVESNQNKELLELKENVARIQEIVNSESLDGEIPLNLQKPMNRTFFSIPPEDLSLDEVDPLGKDSNRFVEDSDPSSSSINQSTYVHQDLDETLDIESIEEETELWMEDLNDFPFISTPDMVPLEDLDDDTMIDNEIFREFRLNKFFKMIQNNITMNVSIAYDPLFENEPMIQNFHSAIVEQEVRNKVIRKRKMMSLLHDKQVFKDYLKEINDRTDADVMKTIPLKPVDKTIDLDKVPRSNFFNEATLLTLQTTKNKLEEFLVEDGIKEKLLYPKFLHIYNLQTLNEDGLNDHDSMLVSVSTDSTSATSATEELKVCPSLQTKIIAYETIDRDVEDLITELMGHVSDLKQSCIKYGAAVSETEIPDQTNVIYLEVQDILNDVLDQVFEPIDLTRGHFNQCFSFIREFGKIQMDKTTLSYQIKPVVKNIYQIGNNISLAENLQRANGYLSSVYQEMCEYNPIPMLDFQEEEPIEEPLIYKDNLIDFDYQPNFETELSIIHEEDETEEMKTSIDVAENILQFIETSVSDNNNCMDLQDFETVNIASTSNCRDFEPQPGTSKQPELKQSSATICSSLYNLPSVPSTELVSSQHSLGRDNAIETLLAKKFSEIPNSSIEGINQEELLALQVPSNFSQNATILERKSPQTNLLQLLRNLTFEETKNLTKTEVDKCIEENLKSFQESMKETIELNQKTIEMIQDTGNRTPDDVLTIISTLSCNVPVPPQTPQTTPQQSELDDNPKETEWYEKVYTKDEDDTESTVSNHNFDVDTYTDISFEDSSEMKNVGGGGGSETFCHSEFSFDTQYLSCSGSSGKSRDESLAQVEEHNFCSDIQEFVNGGSKYLEQRFNFGINLATLLNEEFERKTKLNFGEQLEGDQNQLSNIPEEEEDDDGLGSSDSSSSTSSTTTVVENSGLFDDATFSSMVEEIPADADDVNVSGVEVTDSNQILDDPDIIKNAEL